MVRFRERGVKVHGGHGLILRRVGRDPRGVVLRTAGLCAAGWRTAGLRAAGWRAARSSSSRDFTRRLSVLISLRVGRSKSFADCSTLVCKSLRQSLLAFTYSASVLQNESLWAAR